jgi:hypothetical protein
VSARINGSTTIQASRQQVAIHPHWYAWRLTVVEKAISAGTFNNYWKMAASVEAAVLRSGSPGSSRPRASLTATWRPNRAGSLVFRSALALPPGGCMLTAGGLPWRMNKALRGLWVGGEIRRQGCGASDKAGQRIKRIAIAFQAVPASG